MIKNKCKKTVSAMLIMTMIATTFSVDVFAGGEASCVNVKDTIKNCCGEKEGQNLIGDISGIKVENNIKCEVTCSGCCGCCCKKDDDKPERGNKVADDCITTPEAKSGHSPTHNDNQNYKFNKDTGQLTLLSNYKGTEPIATYMDKSQLESVKKVTIERGVVRLVGTFQECYSLTSVIIQDTVKEIGENAFADCKDLESVKIPASVTKIGAYAFKGCTSLKEVIIPDSVEEISEHAFDGCASVKDVTIGRGVEKIGKNAFANCTLLSSVTNLGKCDLLSGRKKIFDNCACDLHITH